MVPQGARVAATLTDILSVAGLGAVNANHEETFCP